MLPTTPLAFIRHFLRRQWKGFLLIQLLCLAWTADFTLWPLIIKNLIDAINNFSGDKATIWEVLTPTISWAVALWLTVEVAYRVQGFMIAYVFPRCEAAIRMALFDYTQYHSHNYFAEHFAGSIANKIADMPQSVTRLLQLVMTVFVPCFVALIISCTLFGMLQPLFALILGGWVCVHIGICLAFARQLDHYSEVHSEARSNLQGKIVDSFTNTLNVRLFARHRAEYAYVQQFQQDELQKQCYSLRYIEYIKIILGIACFLGTGVLLTWYTFHIWQQGKLTTGEVVFILNTAWNITMMAWLCGLQLPQFFKEVGICRQALSILKVPHGITDKPDAKPLQVTHGEIVFENVTFRYQRNNNLFEDKSVLLHGGQKIGLVGFSGSGKTTFVHLILRFYDIHSGRILVDGQDIATVTQESLHRNIAMIPQDTSLFHRTLMENIRYGRLDATDEEVIGASKRAHCHEFISQLPEGYHALVGERGVKLSGGQRQRIAIARAILKNAPILILDEATSALDSVTEEKIQSSLQELMQGRTTIVVAHRLSTLLHMDRILVFDKGSIIEDGTHAELLTQNGHYAKLWHMQAGGFLPERETSS